VTKALKRVQKTARADVGKLSETILSCGGTPENGTEMKADDVDLGDDNVGMLRQLRDLETDLNDSVGREREEIEHQMRTRGILDALKSNSAERLELLSDLIDRAEAAAR
jgi:hypothetical protein